MSKPMLRRKPLTLLIIVTLTFLVCYPTILPFGVVAAQTQEQTPYYNRDFAWNYGGECWTWNLSIPATLYEAYVAVPDSVRTQIPLSGFGYFTTTEDSYLQSIVTKINATATQQGYNSYQEVNFVLAFVQSIPYATDLNSTGYQDYPRFPVETLVDNVGDCKSHSILFATLTLMLGYGAVFINPPDHLAVGILGDNLHGAYWVYDNQTYYYCETTGEGFTIGQLPVQFDGESAYVYPIDTSKQYVVNVQSISSIEPNPSSAPYGPNTLETTPTFAPIPMTTPLPTVAGPTIQPVQPLSLNLISDDPILFVLIIAAIGLCIAAVIKPVKIGREKRVPQQTVSPETGSPKAQEADLARNKFCIFCGSSNRPFALYCESCGKKIA
jgi:predicted transglutaminase-like cysteine proteinase